MVSRFLYHEKEFFFFFLQNYFHFREAMLHPSVVPYTLQQMSLKWQMLYWPQVTWKSHCHVVQWSDLTGCHLRRGRMSGGRQQPFCCFTLYSAIKQQLPFEGPSSPSSLNVSVEKPEVQSSSCLKAKSHSKPNHPPNHGKSKSLERDGVGGKGMGALCKVLLFLVRVTLNISTSAIDPTEEVVFYSSLIQCHG